jgi:pimeloyl-ACP methyl ester carboxylesterase
MSTQAPDTIVLIHGLWMSPLSWENWIDRYQNAGYNVIAPAWPGMADGVDALRTDPTAIEHLGIEEIIDHYDTIIAELPSPPIIMGHSFGGAFAESCWIEAAVPPVSGSTPPPSRGSRGSRSRS